MSNGDTLPNPTDVVKQAIAVLGDLAGDPVAALRRIANTTSIDDAITLIDGLLELSSSSASSPWLRCLAVEFLFVAGRTRDSIELARTLRHCPVRPVTRTAMLTELIAAFQIEPTPALLTVHRSALESSNDIEMIAATAVIAEAAWDAGKLEESVHFARLAAGRTAMAPSPFWRSYLKLELAAKLVDTGRPVEAASLADEVAGSGDREGHPGNAAAFDLLRVKALLHLANPWSVPDALYGEIPRSTRQLGERLFTPSLLVHLGIASAYAEDFDSAQGYLRECASLQQKCDAPLRPTALSWLRLLVTAAESGPPAAVESIRQLESSSKRPLLPMFAQVPGSAAWCVRQALRAGATSLLDRVVASAGEVRRLNPGLPQLLLAEQHASSLRNGDTAGLVAAATGQVDGWAKACAAADLVATIQHGTRPATPARPADDSSVRDDSSDRLGEQLSARERQVAQLVVQGLTNRQIASRARCSPHTVNFHIRNIFRKLGIHSRIEIAHYLPRRAT